MNIDNFLPGVSALPTAHTHIAESWVLSEELRLLLPAGWKKWLQRILHHCCWPWMVLVVSAVFLLHLTPLHLLQYLALVRFEWVWLPGQIVDSSASSWKA